VRQVRGSGLEIKNVTATLPFIKVTVEDEVPGRSYRLKIGFSQEVKLTPGNYTGTIKVETNNPDMPVVELTVSLIAQ
jgi:hypothetical protein